MTLDIDLNIFPSLDEISLSEETVKFLNPTPNERLEEEIRETDSGPCYWYHDIHGPQGWGWRYLPPEGGWEVEPPPPEVHHLLPEGWEPFESGAQYILLAQENEEFHIHSYTPFPVKGSGVWAFRCGREGRVSTVVDGNRINVFTPYVPAWGTDEAYTDEYYWEKEVADEYRALIATFEKPLKEFLVNSRKK